MKIYNFLNRGLVFLFILATVFVGCEENDSGEIINTQLTGSTKVYLDPSNTSELSEAANTIASADGSTEIASENTLEIAVVRTGTDFSSEASVNYTATVTYASTTDFFDEGDDASSTVTFSNDGAITIPAGETRGFIVVAIKDDVLATGNRSIGITLTGTSVGELGQTESAPQTSATFTIIDDDCPIAIEDWVGVYSVDENFTSGVNAPNGLSFFFGESYQVEFAVNESDASRTSVVITNSDGFDQWFNDGIIMKFLTCPGTVSFSEPAPNLAAWNNYDFETSSYNEGNFSIKCEGPLLNFGPYQFTLTKQQ